MDEFKYKKISKAFNAIKNVSTSVQGTITWLEDRQARITGSDAGAILDMSKYDAQYSVILKKLFGQVFEKNDAMHHGNIFEDVACMLYEYYNDVNIKPYGLISHRNIEYLGASPDGIVSELKKSDGSPTKMFGRMLEIKCPTKRNIIHTGKIKDGICPLMYWCQIQQQLECADLEECDFFQCKFERYSRLEYINDTNTECSYLSKSSGYEKGIIIETLPFVLKDLDFENNKIVNNTKYEKTTYIYPPKINMSVVELDNWLLSEIDNLKNKRLHNIIYWRLVDKECTLIERDEYWFKNQLPVYNKIWSYIDYLKNNYNVSKEWKSYIDSMPRKYNKHIMSKLDDLIERNNLIKKKNDIEYSILELNKVKEDVQKYFNIVLNDTDELHAMDYYCNDKFFDIKTRRHNHDMYYETMVLESKYKFCKNSNKECYFIFNFLDGLYYYRYDNTSIFGFGICKKEKTNFVYIPIKYLIQILI